MIWNFWAGYVGKLAVVAVVLATLYALGRKLRQIRFFGSTGRCVRVIDSAMLSPNAAIHVLRVGERYLVVGASSAGVTKLAELAPTEIEHAEPVAKR
jgi:flagellar protein FliO/FliZ